MLHSVTDVRERALKFVEEHNRHWRNDWSVEATITDAALVVAFLENEKPPQIRVRVGLVREQSDDSVSTTQPKGNVMQLKDNQKVSYDIDAQDAKGVDIPGEAFNAVSSDEGVVVVSQNEDGSFEAVAGLPGSAVLTFTEPGSGLFATEAIDVVPGDVATITVNAGTPEDQ